MKHIKDIDQVNESETMDIITQLTKMARNPLGLNNYYLATGQREPDRSDYYDNVIGQLSCISMDVLCVSEKNFTMLDRMDEVLKRTLMERQDEVDTIIHNSKQHNFRFQYCAEIVFHTVLQGKLSALLERPYAMGGFKI